MSRPGSPAIAGYLRDTVRRTEADPARARESAATRQTPVNDNGDEMG